MASKDNGCQVPVDDPEDARLVYRLWYALRDLKTADRELLVQTFEFMAIVKDMQSRHIIAGQEGRSTRKVKVPA